ncbi:MULTISPECIES: TetR/AcrR family transcriptional regulator [unclassified Pseudomonas]|uniref:TetR/AcrR family transcriptional regulator n=1 Tax=unclassified Pseudomonas TaxID=196821 RepID=UPI0002A3FC3D|nr:MULTISPECIES: TetR/AcrR family transcriptional regulator [unclassified Pseudomonas]MBB1606039.1 TetR family transcriptional regulator [Pseudomonas sp. UMC76]MBB1642232.1 TetR family transcriptional regulator [Pseudomonas sp. UME83]NTX88431.1 TetR/AcrR family transcriptional regulator [Pseudomonas sp. UMA643]NTY19847.1 TetR/AcrR family transcriptional regulator [Pseudomonas sp. UMC3103]NTY28805.1 TetR/AcrR family transcriptional regulator [Pseudomonas sp. UMA603]
MGRASRKDDILQAALACFSESGVDATTIEMIRDRSGASIGSLYHHFGNRERIIGALYLEGIGQYAALLDAGLREGMGAEATVRLFVTCYIDWVVAHPDWARFILHNRGRVEAGEMGEQLREANRQQGRRIAELLAVHRQAGAFREMPFELFNSVVIGPTHDYVRNWLAGRTRVELADCRDLLAQIAWESVRA